MAAPPMITLPPVQPWPVPETQQPANFELEHIPETTAATLSDNVQLMQQLRTALAAGRAPESLGLLKQFRDNLYRLISTPIASAPSTPSPMPILPVCINETLADSVLGRSVALPGMPEAAGVSLGERVCRRPSSWHRNAGS